MKHYLDIENLREDDIVLNGEITRKRNDLGFRLNDSIVISEKTDGSCSSISWDSFKNELRCFSHKQELAFDKTLNGFWDFAHNLDVEIFKQNPNWIFFGEWTGCNRRTVYTAMDMLEINGFGIDVVKEPKSPNKYKFVGLYGN